VSCRRQEADVIRKHHSENPLSAASKGVICVIRILPMPVAKD
jgi:hypothetical protein